MGIVIAILGSWLAFNVVVLLVVLYANRRQVLAERTWLRGEIARMLRGAEAYANGSRLPTSWS